MIPTLLNAVLSLITHLITRVEEAKEGSRDALRRPNSYQGFRCPVHRDPLFLKAVLGHGLS